jgi:hypothetical protein
MRNLVVTILLLVILASHTGAEETDPNPNPTALFSAVFWGKPTTRSLLYAPWGNLSELNSTKSQVQVAYGSLSRKCAYYGEGNIEFHQQKLLSALEMDLIEDNNAAEKASFFLELPFSASPDTTKEFIALFSPSDQKGNFNGYLVPFSQNEIPWGSYKIFSQFKETLYITAGSKKFTLKSGKNLILQSKDFEGKSRVKMLIYRNIKGKYIESGAQNFSVNNRQRGILFLTTKRKRLEVVPLLESKVLIEQAIGYGLKPRRTTSDQLSQEPLNPADQI